MNMTITLQRGSEILFQRVISRRATSTSGIFETCDRRTLRDTRSAISLRVSASGLTRYALPAGATIGQCGRALAPVNLSARQAKEAGLLTSGTYGPHGFTL